MNLQSHRTPGLYGIQVADLCLVIYAFPHKKKKIASVFAEVYLPHVFSEFRITLSSSKRGVTYYAF